MKGDVLNFSEQKAPEVESAVLGLLLTEGERLPDVETMLTAEMFGDGAHRAVYASIVAVDRKGEGVDLLTVGEEMKRMGKLDAVGGWHYLSQLTNRAGSAVNLDWHVRIIVQQYVSRALMRYGESVKVSAGDVGKDVADVLVYAQQELDRIQESVAGGNRMERVGRVAERSVAGALERERKVRDGGEAGITTGFRSLDRMTAGLKGGQLVILAGRPGSGKTSVMLGMAQAAAESGVPVCVFSLEMTAVSLTDRLLVGMSGVDAKRYRSGRLGREDFAKLDESRAKLDGMELYVDDRSGVSMAYVRGVARVMHKKGKCGAVFIDYLQLINTGGSNAKYNREQEVAQVSNQAKALAKELGVPVVMLSQLNRDCEKRTDKRPELSDLRDSGAIEQDADVVVMVYRPEYYGLKTMDGEPIKHVGKLIVAKHRDGPVGEVKFGYNDSLTKVWDAADGEIPF